MPSVSSPPVRWDDIQDKPAPEPVRWSEVSANPFTAVARVLTNGGASFATPNMISVAASGVSRYTIRVLGDCRGSGVLALGELGGWLEMRRAEDALYSGGVTTFALNGAFDDTNTAKRGNFSFFLVGG